MFVIILTSAQKLPGFDSLESYISFLESYNFHRFFSESIL